MGDQDILGLSLKLLGPLHKKYSVFEPDSETLITYNNSQNVRKIRRLWFQIKNQNPPIHLLKLSKQLQESKHNNQEM